MNIMRMAILDNDTTFITYNGTEISREECERILNEHKGRGDVRIELSQADWLLVQAEHNKTFVEA